MLIDGSRGPFFLYLAYRDPHRTAKVESRYRGASVYVPPIRANVNEADVSDKPVWVTSNPLLAQRELDAERTEQTQAQRALLAVDDGVQRVVDALKAKGELDNTLLIFLSDNGYSWGSHRHVGKSCAFEECARIPMLIRYLRSPTAQKPITSLPSTSLPRFWARRQWPLACLRTATT